MKQSILNKAIRIASQLQNKKQNICAIITDKRNNILSIGLNSYSKSSPLQKLYADKIGDIHKIFNHGEIDAIKKLPYSSIPEKIYIARVAKNKQTMPCQPCEICSLALRDAGIRKIITT
jgi:tRNA(Arg) A34 adenosine deaminase TadA